MKLSLDLQDGGHTTIKAGLQRVQGEGSRVRRVDVVDGHSAFDGAQCKASWLVLLVFEDAHSSMLILERTVNFLQRQSQIPPDCCMMSEQQEYLAYPELRWSALKLVHHQASRCCTNHGHGVALEGRDHAGLQWWWAPIGHVTYHIHAVASLWQLQGEGGVGRARVPELQQGGNSEAMRGTLVLPKSGSHGTLVLSKSGSHGAHLPLTLRVLSQLPVIATL